MLCPLISKRRGFQSMLAPASSHTHGCSMGGYLIMNLALGGIFGGNIKKTDLLGELLVDFVRVYPLHCE